MKVTLYAPEDNPTGFVSRLLELEASWRQSLSLERHTMYPMCDDRRIRRNENGIGITLDYLPREVPPMFAGVELSLVQIEDDYISDGSLLVSGAYRRTKATATVTRHTQRPQGGPSYDNWRINVSGCDFKAVVRLYDGIRAGTIKPRSSWDSEEVAGGK